MSIVEVLSRADQQLADRLDAVTSAVDGIGAATLAAKKRLAIALDAARARMAAALADVAALAEEVAGDFLANAEGELLALPESIPNVRDTDPGIPADASGKADGANVLPTPSATKLCPICALTLWVTQDCPNCTPKPTDNAPVNRVYDNEVKDYHEDTVKGCVAAGLSTDDAPAPKPSANGRKGKRRR